MEKLMGNEGLWHLLELIFGYLDHETIVICRKVSYLWDESLEPLERSFLVKILREFGDKIADYHRSVKMDTEEEVLIVISGWNEAVHNYGQNASIEDLRELKNSLKKLIRPNDKCLDHPVQNCVKVGNVKLLEFLFSASYDVNDRFNRGCTAFLWACTYGNTKAAKWILELTKEKDLNCLNDRDNAGMTAFHWACYNHETAEWILSLAKENNGIDFNARDERGMTPFLVACESGETETAQMLLNFSQQNGRIDLSARDDRGRTAFHMACTNHKADTPKIILDFSKENDAIDLNARDNRGMTAFHLICKGNGKHQFAKWILDFSLKTNVFDLNARDSDGMTALHRACRDTPENVILILDFAKEHGGIDIHAKDTICGFTAFHWACNNDSIECVKLFLKFSQEMGSISLNATDDYGRTAFHVTCYMYNTEMAKLILDFSKENGKIDLNARDDNGETAFQVACAIFSIKIVKMILENWKEFDIDITNKNIEGQTALDILRGHDIDRLNELITMLEEEYLKIDAEIT